MRAGVMTLYGTVALSVIASLSIPVILASQHRKSLLRTIEISGTSYFSVSMIRSSLKLARISFPVTPEMVEADIAMNITPLLKEFGFLESKVDWKMTPLDENSAALGLQISEGPQYRLGDLEISGVTAFPLADVASKFELHIGDIVNLQAVRRGLDGTLALYRDYGYVDCSYIPTLDLDPNRRTASLRYEFAEGMQYRIAYVGFTGVADQAEEDRLRMRVNLGPGEIFSATRQRAACAALREFGLANDTVEIVDQKRGLLGLVFWLQRPQ